MKYWECHSIPFHLHIKNPIKSHASERTPFPSFFFSLFGEHFCIMLASFFRLMWHMHILLSMWNIHTDYIGFLRRWRWTGNLSMNENNVRTKKSIDEMRVKSSAIAIFVCEEHYSLFRLRFLKGLLKIKHACLVMFSRPYSLYPMHPVAGC